MGKKGQNKIPDRWLDYSKLGSQMAETKFICFKVPLKAELVCNKAIHRSEWWLPMQLMQELGKRGVRLGLLIDLTNTDRYYDPKDITYSGAGHVKINVTGQDLPSLREVKEFFNAVDSFEATEQNGVGGAVVAGESLIGVHCTHGVNRTGYLVCRYLVERKGWSAIKAVHEFNIARGHQIEKAHYIAALQEAEREYIKTKHAQIDLHPIMDETSSSSSDEEMDQDAQDQAPITEPIPIVQPQPMALPGWQLFQQMMMGVAQMQAMMRMNAPSTAADEESSSEDESEESSSEDSDTSDAESKKEDLEGATASPKEGWEMGGKVELKPKLTTAQKRRARRKNLRDEFRKMKKGKFWEIREMQKKKYGI